MLRYAIQLPSSVIMVNFLLIIVFILLYQNARDAPYI